LSNLTTANAASAAPTQNVAPFRLPITNTSYFTKTSRMPGSTSRIKAGSKSLLSNPGDIEKKLRNKG